MTNLDSSLGSSLFNTDKDINTNSFFEKIRDLSVHHYQNCIEYKSIIDSLFIDFSSLSSLNEIPFLPTSLFKEFELMSIKRSDVFKIMTSSGTSGQSVSKIFLDKNNATKQTQALSSIMRTIIGSKRLPMLIIDNSDVVKNRNLFSARGAGILGFSMFGKDHTYALDDKMKIDFKVVNSFAEKYHGQPVFVFGFTFMIWQYFLSELESRPNCFDFPDGILLHGGGWKKLQDQEVSNDDFKSYVRKSTGIRKVFNYYGMVEQTGSLFVECEEGYLHPSCFSDVIIRDPYTLRPLSVNNEGLIQVLSLLPTSYPGHSLLTEDLGLILGDKCCACGIKGKYFKVNGRVPKAEIRGCSDTHSVTR